MQQNMLDLVLDGKCVASLSVPAGEVVEVSATMNSKLEITAKVGDAAVTFVAPRPEPR